MKTVKEQIYEYLLDNGEMTVSAIVEAGNFGRQSYVSRVLAQLKDEGRLLSRKSGRLAYYRVANYLVGLEENLKLKGLKEDEIWEKVRANRDFVGGMSERVENILYFAFTEMLNNAVDHSKSGVGYVKVWQEENIYKFIVRDKGVGVFLNLMAKKKLRDEVEAIQELAKGKQTTAPRRHSGEGIFWVSKIADKFSLKSYNYEYAVDNELKDYTIKKNEKKVMGTEVYFEIRGDTQKSLQKLFEKFALDHVRYSFDTTEIPVKLFEAGDVWISRSQAKRILSGLEKYKKIILDFKGIEVIGQGFADEIFRVFEIAHPEIMIEAVNMAPSVEILVRRAENDRTGR